MINTDASTDTPTPRRVGATTAMLLAGPLVTLAGMAATPWEPESTSASYLQTLAAHPGRAQLSAALLVVGYALLGLAMFRVLQLSSSAPRALRYPALGLTFCLATILPGMVTVDWLQLAMAQGLPLDQATRVMDHGEDFALFQAVRIPAIAGMTLGALLTAAAAWRAGLVGVWALPATVAGFAAATAGPAGIIAGAAVPVAVYAAIAVSVAGPRDVGVDVRRGVAVT